MTYFAAFRDHVFTISSDVIRNRASARAFRGARLALDLVLVRFRASKSATLGRPPTAGSCWGRGGGTLVYRNRVTDAFDLSPAQSASLKREFSRIFPRLADRGDHPCLGRPGGSFRRWRSRLRSPRDRSELLRHRLSGTACALRGGRTNAGFDCSWTQRRVVGHGPVACQDPALVAASPGTNSIHCRAD